MDEELLRKLRHNAVDAGMSLSTWIAVTLEGLVSRVGEVDRARIRSLERLERGFRLGGKRMSRDELHAR
jgi:hypothetical protein